MRDVDLERINMLEDEEVNYASLYEVDDTLLYIPPKVDKISADKARARVGPHKEAISI